MLLHLRPRRPGRWGRSPLRRCYGVGVGGGFSGPGAGPGPGAGFSGPGAGPGPGPGAGPGPGPGPGLAFGPGGIPAGPGPGPGPGPGLPMPGGGPVGGATGFGGQPVTNTIAATSTKTSTTRPSVLYICTILSRAAYPTCWHPVGCLLLLLRNLVSVKGKPRLTMPGLKGGGSSRGSATSHPAPHPATTTDRRGRTALARPA